MLQTPCAMFLSFTDVHTEPYQDHETQCSALFAPDRHIVHALQRRLLRRSTQRGDSEVQDYGRELVLHSGLRQESGQRPQYLGHTLSVRQPHFRPHRPVQSNPRDWEARRVALSQILGHDEAIWHTHRAVYIEVEHDCSHDLGPSSWRCFQLRFVTFWCPS